MTDRELIDRCIDGDNEAFERLYAEHAGSVMAYLLRSGFAQADADDLIQEIFIRAARSLRTFDPARGSFRQWLSAIARNAARRQWTRRVGGERFDPELADQMFASPDNPTSTPEAREQLDAVASCVARLPEEVRRIVELRYVHGLTTRAIADETGVPESTIRLRLTEARDMIEAWLKEMGFVE
jgi:RNA polymerase sigma-70 factor (ECF subfamily)